MYKNGWNFLKILHICGLAFNWKIPPIKNEMKYLEFFRFFHKIKDWYIRPFLTILRFQKLMLES